MVLSRFGTVTRAEPTQTCRAETTGRSEVASLVAYWGNIKDLRRRSAAGVRVRHSPPRMSRPLSQMARDSVKN